MSEKQKEETTLKDFLSQKITVKVYQLIIICGIGIVIGVFVK